MHVEFSTYDDIIDIDDIPPIVMDEFTEAYDECDFTEDTYIIVSVNYVATATDVYGLQDELADFEPSSYVMVVQNNPYGGGIVYFGTAYNVADDMGI